MEMNIINLFIYFFPNKKFGWGYISLDDIILCLLCVFFYGHCKNRCSVSSVEDPDSVSFGQPNPTFKPDI